MDYVVSLILISLSFRELYLYYKQHKRKELLDSFFIQEAPKARAVVKKDQTSEFEKIVAKNNAIVEFFRNFNDEHIWKLYAVVLLFSLFYLVNRVGHFVEIDQGTLVIALVVIAVLVIFVPERIIRRQTEKRIKAVSRDLPMVIDIIAIMIKSGMTIENSFKYLSTKVKPINGDISTVFERACMLMDVNGVEAALDLIYREVPSKEMRMLCATLKRSISFGNSIYETLLDLSSEIREMQKLDIEEKIAAISAKMTVPMMFFILAPVLVIIGGPVFMRLMAMF